MNSDLIALYVLSKSPKTRYCLVFGTLFLIGIAWLQIIYIPLHKMLYLKKEEFCQLQKEIQTVEQQISLAPDLNNQLIRVRNEIEEYATISSQHMQEKFFSLIANIKNHKLSLMSWQPGPIEQKEWYYIRPLSCVLQGSFENFISFFAEIPKKNYFLCCKHIVIEKAGPQLKVYCTFNCISKQSESDV